MKTLTLYVARKNDAADAIKMKIYYYKDESGKEIIIGNEENMKKFHVGKTPEECHINPYFKWVKARRQVIWESKTTLVIDSWNHKQIESHINHMTRELDRDWKVQIQDKYGCVKS